MKRLITLFVAAIVVSLSSLSLQAAPDKKPGFGQVYYEGELLRVILPPAAMPQQGKDDLYAIPDQPNVSAVAPGNKNYHGGQWAVWIVEWVNEPYLLTSYEDVMAAWEAGDISITRAPQADVKCPVFRN